jgi:coenzyme F420-reducing hydrogenase delta subunit
MKKEIETIEEIVDKVYFLEPLEKVISIKELRKIMDTVEELVNKLREGK